MELGPKTQWDLSVAILLVTAFATAARPQYFGDWWTMVVKDVCSGVIAILSGIIAKSTGALTARPK